MPALKNRKHEAFAQACAVGMRATDAYRATYATNAKNVDVLSSRLALLVHVGKRIAEIQADAAHHAHLTITEKRSIYAKEGRDSRNKLFDRLTALKHDSELAKHVQTAANTTNTINATFNVVTLSEDRRKELMDKKRFAIERRRAAKVALTNGNGHSHN